MPRHTDWPDQRCDHYSCPALGRQDDKDGGLARQITPHEGAVPCRDRRVWLRWAPKQIAPAATSLADQ